jgi:hypothetical protein
MEYTKQDIKNLISDGELDAAADAAISYAEFCGLEDIAGAALQNKSRQAVIKLNWQSGQLTPENYIAEFNKIIHQLIQLTASLPDHPQQVRKTKKPLKDTVFKQRIFWMMCIVNFAILARLLYNTGGFTMDELIGTLSLLAPALIVYVRVMVDGFAREQQRAGNMPVRYLSGPLIPLTYLLMLVYPIVI